MALNIFRFEIWNGRMTSQSLPESSQLQSQRLEAIAWRRGPQARASTFHIIPAHTFLPSEGVGLIPWASIPASAVQLSNRFHGSC